MLLFSECIRKTELAATGAVLAIAQDIFRQLRHLSQHAPLQRRGQADGTYCSALLRLERRSLGGRAHDARYAPERRYDI
ncbi:MAG: hypothetical protein LBJ10_11755, partial [Clostridiales bacterium]|nr:hypothetical protein [Clostridiales bacterium]